MIGFIITFLAIILIILIIFKSKSKERFNNVTTKLDFVTLVFNHKIEIQLLKLQAHSFKYVELESIKL